MKKSVAALLMVHGLLLGQVVVYAQPKNTSDPRIKYLMYSEEEVFNVHVAMGIVTRVILNNDETIVTVKSGFSSSCSVDAHEWCVVADKGENQIWVKPKKDKATVNNLEVQTTKRNYSLKFTVGKGAEHSADANYRVVFQYPLALPASVQQFSLGGSSSASLVMDNKRDTNAAAKKESASPEPRIETPLVRNANYSRTKGEPKDEDIVPAAVFDDGRFTYFKFPKNRSVPAIYVLDTDGSEMTLNKHSTRLLVDPQNPKSKVEDDWLVVHKIAKEFMLRRHPAVVLIRNNSFDPDGVETINGTTTPKLQRIDK